MRPRLPSNATCIVYANHGTGKDRITVKHILRDVWWEEQKGVNVINKGVATANSVDITLSPRDDYLPPDKWQALSEGAAQLGRFFTLQEGDRVVFADGKALDAPASFTSTTEVDKYFGANNSHEIMSIDAKRLPGGAIHHWEVGCS